MIVRLRKALSRRDASNAELSWHRHHSDYYGVLRSCGDIEHGHSAQGVHAVHTVVLCGIHDEKYDDTLQQCVPLLCSEMHGKHSYDTYICCAGQSVVSSLPRRGHLPSSAPLCVSGRVGGSMRAFFGSSGGATTAESVGWPTPQPRLYRITLNNTE